MAITNYVVRNADCHAKIIALYYSSLTDAAYTPVFDVITTQAYPRYAANPPGLSIAGHKTWMPGRSPETFFNARQGITPRQFTLIGMRRFKLPTCLPPRLPRKPVQL